MLVEAGSAGKPFLPLSSERENEASVQGGGEGPVAKRRPLPPEVDGMMDGVIPVQLLRSRRGVCQGWSGT